MVSWVVSYFCHIFHRSKPGEDYIEVDGPSTRDGHETSMTETRPRRLQVSRRERDVEMHVVINAVVNKLVSWSLTSLFSTNMAISETIVNKLT